MVDLVSMGRRIRTRRIELGLTQRAMAQSVMLSVSFYGHIERGSRVPSLDTLVAIANQMRVGLDYLMADSLTTRIQPHTNEEIRALKRYLREQVLELGQDTVQENDEAYLTRIKEILTHPTIAEHFQCHGQNL